MFTDDQDIDRELKAALHVEPSADFEARVRRRVEADGPSRRFVVPTWLAAAAMLIVVAGVSWLLFDRTNHPAAVPEVIVESVPAPPPVPLPAKRLIAEDPTTESGLTTVRVGRPPRLVEPRVAAAEVLVPGTQLEAIRQIVREVNAGRLFVPDPAPVTTNVPVELVISPVVIEPIPVVTIEPGGGVAPGTKGLQ